MVYSDRLLTYTLLLGRHDKFNLLSVLLSSTILAQDRYDYSSDTWQRLTIYFRFKRSFTACVMFNDINDDHEILGSAPGKILVPAYDRQ